MTDTPKPVEFSSAYQADVRERFASVTQLCRLSDLPPPLMSALYLGFEG
jgi:hypothetical protein